MRQFLRIFILLAFLSISLGAEEAKPEEPANPNEVIVKKPLPNEPVFPLEDLVGKPLKNNDRLFYDLMNMLATMGLILGLLLLALWFVRRLANKRFEQMDEGSYFDVLERRSLSPKTMVYVIEIDGRRIVLAESHQGIARIADYPAPKDLQ